MRHIHYLNYTIYRFSSTALRVALQTILLPLAIMQFVSVEEKGLYLGIVCSIAILFAFPFFILSAYWGDILPWPGIRRRLFIVIGAVIVFISLLLFPLVHSLLSLVLYSIFMFIGITSSESVHAALIVDNFHGAKRVIAGQWLSGFMFLGMLLGPLMASVLTQAPVLAYMDAMMGTDFFVKQPFYLVFSSIAVVTLTCAILNVVNIREISLPKKHAELTMIEEVKNKKYAHFNLFLILCCFVYMVTISLPNFFLFFAKDILLYPHPEGLVGVAMVFLTSCSLLGLRSTSWKFIYNKSDIDKIQMSILIVGVSIIIGMFSVLNVASFFLCACVFGFAYGIFYSVALEFSLKLIPNQKLKGFFMSLSSATTFVSAVLGMFFSGVLLYGFGKISIVYGYVSIGVFYLLLLLCAFLMLKKLSGELAKGE